MLIALLACTTTDPTDEEAPADTGATTAEACGYTPATDLDSAEDVVEVDLTASTLTWDPGTGVPLEEGVAYAGQVPGPLIEADVGDTVVAHFVNDLDLPLVVHWHGLRIDEAMDGGMTQMMVPVEPGETFDYVFSPPDAGFYWYHPHLEGATHIERGLYGPMIVRGPGEGGADCDLPIMLDVTNHRRRLSALAARWQEAASACVERRERVSRRDRA